MFCPHGRLCEDVKSLGAGFQTVVSCDVELGIEPKCLIEQPELSTAEPPLQLLELELLSLESKLPPRTQLVLGTY